MRHELVGVAVGVLLLAAPALAEQPTGALDRIGRLIAQAPKLAEAAPSAKEAEADPRAGDPQFEQASKLMKAIDAILQDTAKNRADAKKLPSQDEFVLKPIWTETKEDREKKIRDLLDAALGVVTDVPVVDVQKKIEEKRKNIRDIEDRIVKLREKRLTAPKDGMLPGILNDTVDSIDKDIVDQQKRIQANKDEIKSDKTEIQDALKKSGIQMSSEQLDLLLDSVLSGDLVRLVASFNAAKLIDQQLGKLVAASGDNLSAARKYFAMHAALFAMLVHGQDTLIEKIDKTYLPRLAAIDKDVKAAREKTRELLKANNRPDQKKALEANLRSQDVAERAGKVYRQYLMQQRQQMADARMKATHDLKIADNTFETVEASFQLRNLMKDSSTSFEALQKMEAPMFDQIFENEELRKEFENLTRKLDAPTS